MCKHKETLIRANKYLIGVNKRLANTNYSADLKELLKKQLELLVMNIDEDSIENLFHLEEIKTFRTEKFPDGGVVDRDMEYEAYVQCMIDIKTHMMSAILHK